MTKKGSPLTREQARKLYDDLHNRMTQALGPEAAKIGKGAVKTGEDPKLAKELADALRSGLSGKRVPMPRPPAATVSGKRQFEALVIVTMLTLGIGRIVLDGLVMFSDVPQAEASVPMLARIQGPAWTKEEAKVLTALDEQRAKLVERSDRLDGREEDLGMQERELAVKVQELKELTSRLKDERTKTQKQKNGQLEQLANVYGSMNPPEAAHLLEQLDTATALELVSRMPEKRIGQILALMAPDKALTLTKLLTNRSE